ADMRTRRVPHAQPRLAVESRGRLVERDESRSAREGERDRDQSPLAAREPAELPAEQPVEPEALGEHARVKRPRVVAPDELDYLRDTKRRWKGGLLVRDADASPRRGAARVEAEEAHGAAVGHTQAEEQCDRRRLACAVRAEQREHLSFANREREAVERRHRAEALRHRRELGGDHGGRSSTEPTEAL